MIATTDPFTAARVTEFMDVPDEGVLSPSGRFKLARFEVDARAAAVEALKAEIASNKRQGVGATRMVTEGTYTALYRHVPDDPICVWQPVMSDTPNEIDDHADPILHATGRVLVHGLGLGCIVSALIAKPEVDHIDVVEVDEDVIALTGSYYADHPKVTIHHGDCSTYEWPAGTTWNYVWHDIWTQISISNLSDRENAEFGITYEMMHRKFAARCERQASWAFDHAREMRREEAREQREADAFAAKYNAATPDERLEMLLRAQSKSPIGGEGIDPDTYKDWLAQVAPDILERLVRASNRSNMKQIDALVTLGYVG